MPTPRLVPCPTCGTQVSTYAKACLSCGHDDPGKEEREVDIEVERLNRDAPGAAAPPEKSEGRNQIVAVVAVIVAVLVLCRLFGNDEPARPQQSAPAPAPQSAPSTTASFDQPASVCAVMTPFGLPIEVDWGTQGGSTYSCVGRDLVVTTGGYARVGDIDNVIEYYAESATADRVELVRLSARIFNEQREEPVVARFVSASKALLSRLGLDEPEGLEDAIRRGRGASFETEGATLSLTRDSQRFGHGLILTVSPR